MWNKKDSKINLSASTTLAHTALAQMLEVYFGRRIAFVKNCEFEPRAIAKEPNGSESRYVFITARFCFLDDASETRVYAEVDMSKAASPQTKTGGWKVSRIRFGLGEMEDLRRTWCWGHVVGDEPVLPTVKVACESGPTNPHWCIGRTLDDRRLEPFR